MIDVEFACHVNELNDAVHQMLTALFSVSLPYILPAMKILFFERTMSVWMSESDSPTAKAVVL